jgi:drug/metabolite transporter (DMT)-like permease
MYLIKNKFSLLVVLAFAGIYIIWGSTFLAISYGLEGFPPFVLSGLRFSIAGLLLFLWQKSKGASSGSFSDWRKNGFTGILILTGGTGLVAWGEQYVSSTEAAIAIATGPFWFIALDQKKWKAYFSNKFIIGGLVIGFVGLILFLKGSMQAEAAAVSENIRVLAFAVLTVSSVSWVLGSLYSKNNPAGTATLMSIAQQLSIAGLASFVIATVRGEWSEFSPAEVGVAPLLGLGFLIVFGSVLAYVSYIWLLTVKDAVLVSTHTYINPIVAVIIGWVIAGETISTIQLAGLFVILFGVVLTNSANYKLGRRTMVRLRRFQLVFNRIASPYRYVAQW